MDSRLLLRICFTQEAFSHCAWGENDENETGTGTLGAQQHRTGADVDSSGYPRETEIFCRIEFNAGSRVIGIFIASVKLNSSSRVTRGGA